MLWVWLALMIIFIVIEIVTVQIVTIWFAIGSLAALLTSLVTENIAVQISVMLAVSVITLIVTRPFVKKMMKNNVQHTNADATIGQEGVVNDEINNLLGNGTVKIGGALWTARSLDDSLIIPAGTTVTVDEIRGVKVIVHPTH